ncbi:hypothetical protein DMUE_0731 [Dictyocoela muelleri]|nr:hypothetical protein DMUE_0731 [Dictyocoela muelleri]
MKTKAEIMDMVLVLETTKDIFKGDKMSVLSKLVSYGLIKNDSQCICRNQMILLRKKSSGHGLNCFCSFPDHKTEVSVRQDSLFKEITKPLDKVLRFFWCWSRDNNKIILLICTKSTKTPSANDVNTAG